MVERGGEALRFRPGGEVADLRGGSWELEGEPAVAGGDGRGRAAAQRDLPGPAGPRLVGADRPARRRLHRLARRPASRRSTGAASPTPAAAATARCTPATRSARCSSSAAARRRPDEREQWTLRDVAPVVLEHFGLAALRSAGLRGARPAARRWSPSLVPAARAPGVAPGTQAPRRRSPKPKRSRSPTATRRCSRSDARTAALAPSATHGRRPLGGRLLRRRRGGGAGPRRPAQRRGDRVLDRLPGRLEDGARLLRRLRPQAQRPLRLPAALRALPARPGRLAAAVAGRQPRPPRPARLRRLPLLLQPGRNRRLGAARSTRSCSTCSAGRCGSGSAAGARGCGRSGRRPGCWSPRSS